MVFMTAARFPVRMRTLVPKSCRAQYRTSSFGRPAWRRASLKRRSIERRCPEPARLDGNTHPSLFVPQRARKRSLTRRLIGTSRRPSAVLLSGTPVEAFPTDPGPISISATKAVSPLLGVASYRRAVKHLLTSVVREICTLRSVGAGERATALGHPVGSP